MKKSLFNFTLLTLLLFSLQSIGQNTITVKKTPLTIEAIFKSSDTEKKHTYYCFIKDGSVYSFNSNEKEKKVIQNCQSNQWLKSNSIKGKYVYKNDSIAIFPITYSIYGEETTNNFYFQGRLDSTQLNLSAIGQQTAKTFRYRLLYPFSLVIEQ